MFLIFVRTIILYLIILIVVRCMGKKEIGQMQPFEFVISLMIADIASMPLTDTGVPILHGIIPILGLLFAYMVFTICNIASITLREIICGRPAILINKGRIDEKNLIKEKITINELQERLRVKDIFSIEDVEFAILETNGELSVIEKPEKKNITPEDMGIEPMYSGLTYDLVIDGKVMIENLQKLNKTYSWLKKEVNKFGYEPEDALIVTLNESGSIYSQKKEGEYK